MSIQIAHVLQAFQGSLHLNLRIMREIYGVRGIEFLPRDGSQLALPGRRFAEDGMGALWALFHETHKARFGFSTPGEIIEIVNVFRAKIIDVGRNSLTIEATGSADKISAMEDLFRAYGIKELARTGKIALSRGRES